jgi:hypothetical protein
MNGNGSGSEGHIAKHVSVQTSMPRHTTPVLSGLLERFSPNLIDVAFHNPCRILITLFVVNLSHRLSLLDEHVVVNAWFIRKAV